MFQAISRWFQYLCIRLFWPALSYDDILLLPGRTNFQRGEANLATVITKGGLKIELPFFSAPMDYVTNADHAIVIGKAGGLGVLPWSYTIEAQTDEVHRIKEAGLIAAAAIAVEPGWEERVQALFRTGLDILVLDTAHGWTEIQLEILRAIKKLYKHRLQVVAGNIATYEAAMELIKAGADALRVGMGPGSICSTRVVSGMGVPQVTALMEVCRAAKKYGVPVWADGGIRYSGDMTKALALGASAVMMGLLFVAAEESPAEIKWLTPDKVPARFKKITESGKDRYAFKHYRGMGSKSAIENSRRLKQGTDFHGQPTTSKVIVAEGVEGWVPLKGSVEKMMSEWAGGIQAGFFYIGAPTIREAWQKCRFIRITQASLAESHPHDILVEDDGGLYQ